MDSIGTLCQRMSSSYDAEVNQATDALNNGNPNLALEIVEKVLVQVPNQPDALLMKGIALSQLNRSEDASKLFVEAVQASPNSVKARFNAAVHEYNAGRVGIAQQLVKDALSIDPNHQGSKELLNRLLPTNIESTPAYGSTIAPAQLQVTRENTGVPLVNAMGPFWVALGWGLILLTFASFFYTNFLLFTSPAFSKMLSNPGNFDQINAASVELQKNIPNWLQLIDILSRVVALLWMIIDLNHRRGNYLWILPQLLCGLVGCGWMVTPLYMILGRKTSA